MLKRVTEYIVEQIKNKLSKSSGYPQIEIHPRQERPHITIGNVNTYSNQPGVDQQDQGENIGRGIRVKKQGRPKKCPNCASPARDSNNNDNIIPNSAGDGKWCCKICGYIF